MSEKEKIMKEWADKHPGWKIVELPMSPEPTGELQELMRSYKPSLIIVDGQVLRRTPDGYVEADVSD